MKTLLLTLCLLTAGQLQADETKSLFDYSAYNMATLDFIEPIKWVNVGVSPYSDFQQTEISWGDVSFTSEKTSILGKYVKGKPYGFEVTTMKEMKMETAKFWLSKCYPGKELQLKTQVLDTGYIFCTWEIDGYEVAEMLANRLSMYNPNHPMLMQAAGREPMKAK